jgi:hypothetical protein
LDLERHVAEVDERVSQRVRVLDAGVAEGCGAPPGDAIADDQQRVLRVGDGALRQGAEGHRHFHHHHVPLLGSPACQSDHRVDVRVVGGAIFHPESDAEFKQAVLSGSYQAVRSDDQRVAPRLFDSGTCSV